MTTARTRHMLHAVSQPLRAATRLGWRLHPATHAGDSQAAAKGQQRRISRREQAARTAIGMPAGHPELLTRKPRRAEWRHLTAWIAELWPRDEYTAIVTDAWRRDHP
jgi:hypothetical protein